VLSRDIFAPQNVDVIMLTEVNKSLPFTTPILWWNGKYWHFVQTNDVPTNSTLAWVITYSIHFKAKTANWIYKPARSRIAA